MRNFQKAITMMVFRWSQYADKGHTYRKVKSSHVQKWSSISLLVHSRCQIGLFPVWLEPMLQKGALRIKSYPHFIGLAIHWVLKSADSRTNIYNRGIGLCKVVLNAENFETLKSFKYFGRQDKNISSVSCGSFFTILVSGLWEKDKKVPELGG